MELLSAIVTLVSLALGWVIGVRLLLRSSGDPGSPELALGFYFVGYHALGTMISTALYSGWSRPELLLPRDVTVVAHGAYLFCSIVGTVGLLFFTRRTFRPGVGWAAVLAWGLSLGMGLGAFVLALTEGLQVKVMHGAGYWVVLALRNVGFAWLVIEALEQWRLSQRRLRIGLADPLTTNRFLLIGVWAAVTLVLSWSDPIARVWYVAVTGTTTVWVPELGRPIITWIVLFASTFLSISAALLLLSFFPTRSYRAWVERRAEARSSRPIARSS